MRIARADFEGGARTAIVSDDGESVRVLDPALGVLELLGAEDPERLAAGAQERPLSEVRLLAPVVSPLDPRLLGVRAAHRGHRQGQRPRRAGARSWYRSPFCYFSNPRAVTGPGDEIADPARAARDLDLELEVAVVIGAAGRNLTPDEAGAYIAGYTIFNDWSARDLQFEEMKLGLGICKGKDFANTLGPWIVTPDELEPYRSGDRLDLDLRAYVNDRELGDDTLANMAWSFEELIVLRLARDLDPPGRRARLGHLRLGLPARASRPPRPRRLPAAAGRRHGGARGAGHRHAHQHGCRWGRAGAAARGPPGPPASAGAGMRIDCHAHVHPPAYRAALGSLPLPPTTLEGLQADMERYEIDAAVDLGGTPRGVAG